MNPEAQNLVAAGKLSPADAEKLSQLEAGTFVLHKSWGVGRISSWDIMSDKIIIDFEGKPGHGLKISFALTSLEVLPETHILSRRLSDLAGMKEMAKKDPSAIVELALKSSGSQMSLDKLEGLLKPHIISEADYKKWWEGAKKALKSARHIVVPSKRQDPLVLRDSAEKPGGTMVAGFLAKRDLKGNEAGLKYYLMGVFASAVLLYGMSLAFGVGRSTRLDVIAANLQRLPDSGVPVVTLATAHPAKFPDAVESATGIRPPLPEHLADLFERPERVEHVDADLASVQALLRAELSRS